MDEIAAAARRLIPALVFQQVERDEFEPRRVGARLGERGAHVIGLRQIAHAAANLIARAQQGFGDVAAEKSGDAGQQDFVGHVAILLE